jgi:N-acetylneuraminic acid mutarotase
VFVFGGVYYELGNEELTQVENCVWKLDLKTFKWKKLKIRMPKLTFFHASAISSVRKHILLARISNKTIDDFLFSSMVWLFFMEECQV